MKNFDHIPEDRNDKECQNCGGGWLGNPRYIRTIRDRFEQYIWECKYCGGDVVMIDENEDQTCPCCGTENALTLTRLMEIRKETNDE